MSIYQDIENARRYHAMVAAVDAGIRAIWRSYREALRLYRRSIGAQGRAHWRAAALRDRDQLRTLFEIRHAGRR